LHAERVDDELGAVSEDDVHDGAPDGRIIAGYLMGIFCERLYTFLAIFGHRIT